MSQNIMTTCKKRVGPPLACNPQPLKHNCNQPWHGCHKSLVNGRRQIVPDISKGHVNPRYCNLVVFEFWSGELGGQDINWNSTSCSWNHSTQFQLCDTMHCPAGTFHSQLGRLTPCTGATDPQWCSDTP